MVALGIASLLLSQGQVDQVTSAYKFKFIVGTEFEHGLPASRFGLTEDEMIRREDKVWGLVLGPDMDFLPTDVRQLESRLRSLGESVCAESDAEVCKSYFVCLAIGAWVKSHVAFPLGDNREMSGIAPGGNTVDWEHRSGFNLNGMVSCSALEGFCRHSTVLARKMILDALPMVKVFYVSGWPKQLGNDHELAKDPIPHHGWNLVDIGQGIRLLMDCTGTSKAVGIYRDLYAKFRRSPDPVNLIPRRRDELEVFLASHYGGSTDKAWSDADKSGQVKKLGGWARPPWQDPVMKMSVEEWWLTDTKDTLQLRAAIFNEWRRPR